MGEQDSKNALMIQELLHRLQRLETQVASIPMFHHQHRRSASPEARRSGDNHRRVRTRSPKANHGYDRNSRRRRRSSSSSLSSFSESDGYYSHFPRRATYSSSSSSERDSLPQRKRTPFSERIQRIRFPLPKGCIRPTDVKYDGSTDPQKHLDAFEARMNLYKAEDAIRCRAFPVSLSGPAMRWFNNSLPPGSINCFADLSREFLARYAAAKVKHPIYLLDVHQQEGESIRDYLERFKRELLDVNTRSPDVVSFCFVAGLLGGDFRRRLLSNKDLISMEEIERIALEYM